MLRCRVLRRAGTLSAAYEALRRTRETSLMETAPLFRNEAIMSFSGSYLERLEAYAEGPCPGDVPLTWAGR